MRYFKVELADIPTLSEPKRQHAHAGKGAPVMAPLVIMGAMLMLVLWDTSDVQ